MKVNKIVRSLIHSDATFWKAIAPEPRNRGTPNLELEMLWVHSIDQRPHPLPVIYTYSAGTSDYTCHPNAHYLLYNYTQW